MVERDDPEENYVRLILKMPIIYQYIRWASLHKYKLYISLALRICLSTEMAFEVLGSGVVPKVVCQDYIADVLVHDHCPVLVIDNGLRDAPKVPEGVLVRPAHVLGGKGAVQEPGIFHPAPGEYHRKEVHFFTGAMALQVTLPEIDLCLFPIGQFVYRAVLPKALFQGDVVLLTDRHDKVIDRFFAYLRKLGMGLFEPVEQLCGRGFRELLQTGAYKILVRMQYFYLFTLLEKEVFKCGLIHGVILLDGTPINAKMSGDLVLAEPQAVQSLNFIIHNPCVCSSCIHT